MAEEEIIFNPIYKEKKAPWTSENMPAELSKLIENKIILPCDTLDVGCGEGNYSVYLASKGFNATGIDISEEAIKHAKQNAKSAKVSCKFLITDYRDLSKLNQKFDFVFEWRFLHGILDKTERMNYVKLIKNILNPKGKYISLSFSDETECWGKGKIRKILLEQYAILHQKKNLKSYLDSISRY